MRPKHVYLSPHKELFASYKNKELLHELLYSPDPLWANKAAMEYNRRRKEDSSGVSVVMPDRSTLRLAGSNSLRAYYHIETPPEEYQLSSLGMEYTPALPALRFEEACDDCFQIAPGYYTVDMRNWMIGEVELPF